MSNPQDALAQDDELVTIRKSELQELRRQEALYRYLGEKSPLPVVMTSLQTSDILFANQEALDVFNNGVMPQGAALNFYEHPGDRAKLLLELKTRGVLRNYPTRMRRSDQSVGDFLFSMNPAVVEGERVLYSYAIDVSERVAAERALRQRNEEMALILNNIAEGLLTLSAEGHIVGERSAAVARWLGEIDAGVPIWDALGRADPACAAWFRAAWEGVVDGLLPLEVALEQLPRVLRVADRHIRIACAPVGAWSDEQRPARFLVILSDITEAVARERAEAEQRALMGLFDRLLRDRSGVIDFLEEGDALVQRLRAFAGEAGPAYAGMLRDLHTLKGNSALFGVMTVSEACHAVEEELSEQGAEAATPEALARVASTWDAVAVRARGFVEARREGPEVGPEEMKSLQAALAARASHEAIEALVASWQHEPVRQRLARFASQAQVLARRLGKGEIAVVVEDHGLRLPRDRWASFWGSFAHAIRNAVDHGLETPDERRALRKPPVGTLTLEAGAFEDASGPGLFVEIADDGRGIDWERVRARARALGIPAESEADLEHALFADGLSTREIASEISGRGVGTAALLAAVKAQGGEIAIHSTPGQGTRFRFRFPFRVVC